MRNSFHNQARMDQFQRLATTALTDVERQGYLELVERYRKLAEAPETEDQDLPPIEPPAATAPPAPEPPAASPPPAASAPNVTVETSEKLPS